MSPKICTRVEWIVLYKAELLLNIDTAVPLILQKCVFSFRFDAGVGTANQSQAIIDVDWQPTLSHSSLSVPVA